MSWQSHILILRLGVINTLQTHNRLQDFSRGGGAQAATWDCVIAFLIFPSRDPGDLWPGNYAIISGERNQKSDNSRDIVWSGGDFNAMTQSKSDNNIRSLSLSIRSRELKKSLFAQVKIMMISTNIQWFLSKSRQIQESRKSVKYFFS